MTQNDKARQLDEANKRAQCHAELTKAAVINAALTVRDAAAPVIEAGAHQAKRVGAYAGAFVRTLVGR